jgi:hypothetical protein
LEIRDWRLDFLEAKSLISNLQSQTYFIQQNALIDLRRFLKQNLLLDKYRFHRALIGGAHRAVMVGADDDGFSCFIQFESIRANFGAAAAADAFISVNFDDHIVYFLNFRLIFYLF